MAASFLLELSHHKSTLRSVHSINWVSQAERPEATMLLSKNCHGQYAQGSRGGARRGTPPCSSA